MVSPSEFIKYVKKYEQLYGPLALWLNETKKNQEKVKTFLSDPKIQGYLTRKVNFDDEHPILCEQSTTASSVFISDPTLGLAYLYEQQIYEQLPNALPFRNMHSSTPEFATVPADVNAIELFITLLKFEVRGTNQIKIGSFCDVTTPDLTEISSSASQTRFLLDVFSESGLQIPRVTIFTSADQITVPLKIQTPDSDTNGPLIAFNALKAMIPLLKNKKDSERIIKLASEAIKRGKTSSAYAPLITSLIDLSKNYLPDYFDAGGKSKNAEAIRHFHLEQRWKFGSEALRINFPSPNLSSSSSLSSSHPTTQSSPALSKLWKSKGKEEQKSSAPMTQVKQTTIMEEEDDSSIHSRSPHKPVKGVELQGIFYPRTSTLSSSSNTAAVISKPVVGEEILSSSFSTSAGVSSSPSLTVVEEEAEVTSAGCCICS